MRLLLLLILTATNLFSFARNTNALATENTGSSTMETCLPIVLFTSLAIAGLVCLLEINNRRRGKRESSDSEKNT